MKISDLLFLVNLFLNTQLHILKINYMFFFVYLNFYFQKKEQFLLKKIKPIFYLQIYVIFLVEKLIVVKYLTKLYNFYLVIYLKTNAKHFVFFLKSRFLVSNNNIELKTKKWNIQTVYFILFLYYTFKLKNGIYRRCILFYFYTILLNFYKKNSTKKEKKIEIHLFCIFYKNFLKLNFFFPLLKCQNIFFIKKTNLNNFKFIRFQKMIKFMVS